MNTFRLLIITQSDTVFDRQVESIKLPGSDGYLGVWANHAPLIALLGEGALSVRENSDKAFEYKIGGGFLEVSNNVATILADTLEIIEIPTGEKDLAADESNEAEDTLPSPA